MINASSARQQPGSACDECRRKKERCDRQRPRCGRCEKAQTVCRFNEKRHPLRKTTRYTANEINYRLAQSEYTHIEREEPGGPATSASISQDQADAGEGRDGSGPTSLQVLDNERRSSSPHNQGSVSHQLPRQSEEVQLSEISSLDLMQLYLDRVHPMLPILSPATISHLRKDVRSLDQYGRCLRYAMLTIATAFSSQFEDVRDGLYTTTRDRLTKLDLAEEPLDTNRLETTQAWIFIVFYEFIKTNYRRGWLSAGQLFRHVQMMGLYGVDRGVKPSSDDIGAENPILDEEKRRAFWTAYYIDRIISVSEHTPLTLAEEVIYTRLPCPDIDFHNGVVTPQCFLSEAIVSTGLPRYSRIAECAITATICGRTLSHKLTAVVETAYNSSPTDYTARRDWLERLLDTRLESLRINRPREAINPDPLTAFTTMLTHAAVLYLWHTTNLLSEHAQDQTSPLVVRGLESAREICRLAKDIEPRGLFSTHTLTPILLSWCAIRLQIYLGTECPDLGEAEKNQIEEQIQTCLEVVRKLQTVNNIAIKALEPYKDRRVPPLWALGQMSRFQGN